MPSAIARATAEGLPCIDLWRTKIPVTPGLRTRIENTIEQLVALLDQIDGDADLEQTGDDEPYLSAGAMGWSSWTTDDLEDDRHTRADCVAQAQASVARTIRR